MWKQTQGIRQIQLAVKEMQNQGSELENLKMLCMYPVILFLYSGKESEL